MNLRGVKATLALTLTFAAATSVSAAPIHIVSGGLLVGATGVEVLAEFNGCDEFSDFAFTTDSSAIAPATALLEQVLWIRRPAILTRCRG